MMNESTEVQSRVEDAPRILVVDDDAPVRAIAALLLEQVGFRTVQAGSAVEALAVSKLECFDLLLTDVQMPGMDGLELAREMTALHPDLPVVLMSGFAPEAVVEECRLPLIPKPFHGDILIGGIRKALAGAATKRRTERQVA
jgi:CheY-like chemotaxis protein